LGGFYYFSVIGLLMFEGFCVPKLIHGNACQDGYRVLNVLYQTTTRTCISGYDTIEIGPLGYREGTE
jgi:hypothetical protein